MKDVYYNPSEIRQQSLFESTDNIKEDRTPEDLLFQVMLDLGVLLSSKIEETEVAGKKIFNVADNFLVACFDNDITEEILGKRNLLLHIHRCLLWVVNRSSFI